MKIHLFVYWQKCCIFDIDLLMDCDKNECSLIMVSTAEELINEKTKQECK